MRFIRLLIMLLVFAKPMQEIRALYPVGTWDIIIDNQIITQPLQLDSGDNNTLIINSVFQNITGDALTLRNVSNVLIKNNTFKNITGNGIVLRSTGSTDHVVIDGNLIQDISRTAILPKRSLSYPDVDHTNLVISNNTINHIGTDDLDHGMYIMSKDSRISHNSIQDTTGNGISIRSSGIITGNTIWNTQKSCIRYFNDHETGLSRKLVIENNVCHNSLGLEYPLISLLYSPGGQIAWLPDIFEIRFNTLVSTISNNPGIEVMSGEFDGKNVRVYGNISINTINVANAIRLPYIDYLSRNYITDSLEGFSNQTYPYNLHLLFDSPAIDYANGESTFPETDKDGRIRIAGQLDAGAYQYPRTILVKPGDATGDGFVDGQDFIIWSANYMKSFSLSSNGDFNGNNKVDGQDFIIWLMNFDK